MTVNRRKKNVRLRGSKTHGWGAMKKHRGAGHRGGRGNAGSGKRGDAKKPMFWKNAKYFGRHGFKKHGIVNDVNAVNIGYFEDNADKLVASKSIELKDNFYHIDIAQLGYNKLLGCGKITKKFKIKAPVCSAKAKEKIEAIGGEIVQ